MVISYPQFRPRGREKRAILPVTMEEFMKSITTLLVQPAEHYETVTVTPERDFHGAVAFKGWRMCSTFESKFGRCVLPADGQPVELAVDPFTNALSGLEWIEWLCNDRQIDHVWNAAITIAEYHALTATGHSFMSFVMDPVDPHLLWQAYCVQHAATGFRSVMATHTRCSPNALDPEYRFAFRVRR